MKSIDKKLITYTFEKTIPVLVGYFFLGIGFGILLENQGFGLIECIFMSVFIFSGSMQYAGVSLLASSTSLISAFLSTLIINARYFFYSLSLVEKYKHRKRQAYLIHAITDEAYALITDNDYLEGYKEEDYWFLISLFDHSYWIISTIIGVLIGRMINFDIKGIDFVMTALFMSILVEQWMKHKDHIPTIVGVIVPIILLIVVGKDNFLLPSMIIISIICALYKGEKNESQ